jgi:hypothetical protein
MGYDVSVGKDWAVASREEILNEIRRTATEHGGRPVGRDRFRELTGISDYAVAQHWATYGAAVTEAEFEPNKLQKPIEHQVVLRQLIELIRALGHVPTSNELRRARASDRSFPTSGVFERLGSKDERVVKALAVCRELPEYGDVEQILEAYVTEREGEFNAPSVPDADPLSYGFVYLARRHRGEYKIGRTKLVDRRIAELGATSPVELTLIHEIKTDDPAGVEAYWHRRFAASRMRGEWFRLTSKEVAVFRRWKRIA